MKRVYLFSGLGADERVFQGLDFGGFSPVFVDWILPENDDSLSGYAKRLSNSIDDEDPVLIGLSFGGMIAVEVARHIPAGKIILISSAKSSGHLPWYFKLAGKLKLNRLIPVWFYKMEGPLINWLFGAETQNDKQLLQQIIRETDDQFVKWAVNAILNWESKLTSQNVIQIHGSKDLILPARFSQTDELIEGAGHFMIVNRRKEVQEFLTNVLEE